MAKRLLPFRQYAETDVINFYALNETYVNNDTTGVGGYGDQGVAVTVDAANLTDDLISYATNNYLGKTDYPHVYAQYPSVNLKVKPAISGDAFLGVTLYETADYDENGEKLLYYPQKALEQWCVVRGQTVPVLSRGLVTVAESALDVSGTIGGELSVGGGIALSAITSGQFTAIDANASDCVGIVIATGERNTANGGQGSNVTTTDQFSGAVAWVQLK